MLSHLAEAILETLRPHPDDTWEKRKQRVEDVLIAWAPHMRITKDSLILTIKPPADAH